MDRDDLSAESNEAVGVPDDDFIEVLTIFEESHWVEPHHNAELMELFRSRHFFDGEVPYYAVSDEGEVLVTFTFQYGEDEWSGTAENYRVKVDINPDLFDMIFSEQGFKETMNDVVSLYHVVKPQERALELEIPSKDNIQDKSDSGSDTELREIGTNTTIGVTVDIARYFADIIDEDRVKEGLRDHIGVPEE
jgi:hypothetical protein